MKVVEDDLYTVYLILQSLQFNDKVDNRRLGGLHLSVLCDRVKIRMKKLIYLTGKIDSPFFTNEIGVMKEYFNSIHVISYDKCNKKIEELSKKYNFTFDTLGDKKFDLKRAIELIKWTKESYLKQEIIKEVSFNLSGLKRLLYIFYYGNYYCKIKNIIYDNIEDNNDVYLYSFWLSRAAYSIAVFNINRIPQIKRIVSRTHRYDLYEEENRYKFLPFRKFIAENLDTIYFSSNDSNMYYKNKKYSKKEKQALCKLSYLGTLSREFTVDYSHKNKLTIVSCAYISKRKRLDLIVDLIKKLNEQVDEILWIHIGSGELEEKIKSYASLILDKGIYEFKGNVEDKEIFEIYKKYNPDFFVNLSDSEGIPVSLLEALSVGIPGVVRNIGGNSDAIINNFNGILLSPLFPNEQLMIETANKIVSIYTDQKQHIKMSLNARKLWKERFDANSNIAKMCMDIINGETIKEIG